MKKIVSLCDNRSKLVKKCDVLILRLVVGMCTKCLCNMYNVHFVLKVQDQMICNINTLHNDIIINVYIN